MGWEERKKEMQCGACHKQLLTRHVSVCGACQLVTYCGNECAQYDWIVHEKEHTPEGEQTANMVLPNVWIGGAEALTDLDLMGIDAIVTVVHVDRLSECIVMKHVGENRDHMRVSIHDDKTEPIQLYFESVARFINSHVKMGQNVLVHCYAGMSRSVTLVIAYMIIYLKYDNVDAALARIKVARPIAHPNSGFMAKLKELIKKGKE